MNLLGKTTIHPFFFYTGKISGYLVWCLFALAVCQLYVFGEPTEGVLRIFAQIVAVVGLVLTSTSLLNLGSATRLGLPTEKTTLKQQGLYLFSRNPMYVGFDLLTVAGILYLGNAVILLMGLYSIAIYHFIILGEEAFLKKRFGKPYLAYMKKTRRYF